METKKKIIIVENNDLHRAALKNLINAQEHLKDASSQDLLNAISSVLAGIRYVPYLP